MTGSNYVGTFAQTADRIRTDLRARQALKLRVRMLRIIASGRWEYTTKQVDARPLRTLGGVL